MPTADQPLSAAEIDHFLAHGYVHLRGCFATGPGSTAAAWVEASWRRNGIDPDDRRTWPDDKIHMPTSEEVAVAGFAPRAWAAMGQLCGGHDRVRPDTMWGNAFIANYGWGRRSPWVPPSAAAPGWHKDGDFFLHFLDSPEQALLVIVVFTDIGPRGGGTFVCADSVGPVARHLAAHPEGVSPFGGFPWPTLLQECHDFRELTARAGDVVLLHPYIIHASSANHSDQARLITNPCLAFRSPMVLDGSRPPCPVEEGILRGLGVTRTDWRPTAPRQAIIPPRIAKQQELLAAEARRLGPA